jgi:hypothetical protein
MINYHERVIKPSARSPRIAGLLSDRSVCVRREHFVKVKSDLASRYILSYLDKNYPPNEVTFWITLRQDLQIVGRPGGSNDKLDELIYIVVTAHNNPEQVEVVTINPIPTPSGKGRRRSLKEVYLAVDQLVDDWRRKYECVPGPY